MKAALRSGLLAPNPISLPSPPFNCPTGNCTWDAFATLAVGTQCQNLTSEVNLECSGSYDCTFTAPNDEALAYVANGTNSYTVLTVQSDLPTQMPGGATAMRSYANNTASIAMVQWIKSMGRVVGPTSAFEAGRCDFYLSVREVIPKVSNGVYTEEVLQEITRPEPVPGLSYSMDKFPLNFFLSPYESNGGKLDSIIFKVNGSAPSNMGKTYTFQLNQREYLVFSSQFVADDDFLHGKVSTATGGGEPLGPSTLIMLWQADNATRAMYNLAEAITTQMRANATTLLQQAQQGQNTSIIAPEQAIRGYVWVQQQNVVVRWEWLIMPLVLLALAAVFLFIAYMDTRRKHVGLWQSSPLTLFFHAQPVDEEGGRKTAAWDVGPLDTADAMQKAASLLTARISPNGHDTIQVFYSGEGCGFSHADIGLVPRDSLEMVDVTP